MSVNSFAAPCDKCGEPVDPGDGAVIGGRGADGVWTVRHNKCSPNAGDSYWQIAIIRRIRKLVEELERLEIDEIDELRQTPQAALLREWLGSGKPQEYDL